MIKEPWFWRDNSRMATILSTALSPIGMAYHHITSIIQKAKYEPPLEEAFIICVGNAMLGGVGKTPFAIKLRQLLQKSPLMKEARFNFLSRGYGGAITHPTLLNLADHNALDAGDEALLLARYGPTWISKNRKNGALDAQKSGSTLMIADDGFQNASLPKDLSFLLLPAHSTSSNHFIFPAGPFREPVETAIERAHMIIFIGEHEQDRAPTKTITLLKGKPFCHGWLEAAPLQEATPAGEAPHSSLSAASSRSANRFIAFCGIGRPHRFFNTLKRLDYDIVETIAFPDHHSYTDVQLDRLARQAEQSNARLITTEKDFIRLSKDQRENISVLPVTMVLDKPESVIDICEHYYRNKTGSAS